MTPAELLKKSIDTCEYAHTSLRIATCLQLLTALGLAYLTWSRL